ncbi:hypothetical protein [Enterococcus wangshanyuanii]|uniref:Peptidoglycan-binding protein n=1 Tax=Enterococcus wangshanyuanii TaxID=2005703 RepID=A0ABQ1PT98_9ENTE|nr:hypothetical protein [Enterococcus wangshanyuanii]GGD02990.1 peptidoglycan-binding protein [Enterococcus wangshanyuanii]
MSDRLLNSTCKKMFEIFFIACSLLLAFFLNSKLVDAVGDINTDISVSSFQSEILSGQTGTFSIELKATGSRQTYTDAKMRIKLPEEGVFQQSLEELKIDGVTPAYDSVQKQLTYAFPNFKAGKTYKTVLKIVTTNGETKNGSEIPVQAFFESKEINMSDMAKVKIKSTINMSMSKIYDGSQDRSAGLAPMPGDTINWKIKSTVNSSNTGLIFLKEGSPIKITDKIVNSNLEYVGNSLGVEPIVEKQIDGSTHYSWIFPAPSIEEQKKSIEEGKTIFDIEFQVYTKIAKGVKDRTVLSNQYFMSSFGTDDVSASSDTKEGIVRTGTSEYKFPSSNGNFISSVYRGPGNNKGGLGSSVNPNITTTDGADLLFVNQVSLVGGKAYNDPGRLSARRWDYEAMYRNRVEFDYIGVNEVVDPNLILSSIRIYKPTQYVLYGVPVTPFDSIPRISIKFEINSPNNFRKLQLTDEQTTKILLDDTILLGRKDLMLSENERVLSYEVLYQYDDNKNTANTNLQGTRMPVDTFLGVYSNYRVKQGATGTLANRTFYRGKIHGETKEYYRYGENHQSPTDWLGPRTVNIEATTNMAPIVKASVEFLDHSGDAVLVGENKLKATLRNDYSSNVDLQEPIESYILLPKGIQMNMGAKPIFTDSLGLKSDEDDSSANGDFEVVTDNYNGTEQQLIKVHWNDKRVFANSSVSVEFAINVSDKAGPKLRPTVFGFAKNNKFSAVPGTGIITDTIVENDQSDINGDGDTTQQYFKSSNNYQLLKRTGVSVEKFVKKEADANYKNKVSISSTEKLSFQLKVTNPLKDTIDNFVLMDVFPSIDDSGITDNVARGSQANLHLLDKIVLNDEWASKFDVMYSTSENPKRDDLIQKVNYPSTTQKITNPANSSSPIWLSASEVQKWSDIRSFKISLKESEILEDLETFTVEFDMKADENIDFKTEKVMYNSFAVASNDLQVVESPAVEIKVKKDINKINIRQTVLNPNEDVVIPSMGFHVLEGNELSMERPLTSKSTTIDDEQHITSDLFKKYIIFEDTNLVLKTRVPEYYKFVGYILTIDEKNLGEDHSSKNKESIKLDNEVPVDFDNSDECWITVFITPNIDGDDSPKPYSWDYKTNLFGKKAK